MDKFSRIEQKVPLKNKSEQLQKDSFEFFPRTAIKNCI